MFKFHKKYIFSIVVLILIIIIGYIFYLFFLDNPSKGVTPITIEIKKGTNVGEIAEILDNAGIIDSNILFKIYVLSFGLDKKFQPGEFQITPGTNFRKIVEELSTIRIKEKSFTIIEGWTLRDIAKGLINAGWIEDEAELYDLTGSPATDYRKEKKDFKHTWKYDFLRDKPEYANLEGYIYPDTYRVLEDEGIDVLLTKALDNFDKKLTLELRKDISRQGKTIYEVITKASVIEREVFKFEDRRIVSDIIDRRIKYGMHLQMDSTINYFTQSSRARSTYSDLNIDSPWNTYKYAGLPLGPISNPSIWSIRAAIYPKPNSYLYFLTDKAGNIYYAKTGAEHNSNRRYLD